MIINTLVIKSYDPSQKNLINWVKHYDYCEYTLPQFLKLGKVSLADKLWLVTNITEPLEHLLIVYNVAKLSFSNTRNHKNDVEWLTTLTHLNSYLATQDSKYLQFNIKCTFILKETLEVFKFYDVHLLKSGKHHYTSLLERTIKDFVENKWITNLQLYKIINKVYENA